MNNEIEEKYELAIKYLKGIGIEQNYEKAYKIFNELVEKYNIVQRSEPKKKPLTAKELFGI